MLKNINKLRKCRTLLKILKLKYKSNFCSICYLELFWVWTQNLSQLKSLNVSVWNSKYFSLKLKLLSFFEFQTWILIASNSNISSFLAFYNIKFVKTQCYEFFYEFYSKQIMSVWVKLKSMPKIKLYTW